MFPSSPVLSIHAMAGHINAQHNAGPMGSIITEVFGKSEKG
jgi:hypothetical protein